MTYKWTEIDVQTANMATEPTKYIVGVVVHTEERKIGTYIDCGVVHDESKDYENNKYIFVSYL